MGDQSHATLVRQRAERPVPPGVRADVRTRAWVALVALGAVWIAVMAVPVIWRLVTGDHLPTTTAIAGIAVAAVIAIAAGFVSGHYLGRRGTAVAMAVGALTAGSAATAFVLSSQSEDAVPWGAVVVVNFVVNGAAVAIAVALGAAVGARTRR